MYTNNYIHDKQQTNDSLLSDNNADGSLTSSLMAINSSFDESVTITNNSLTKALSSINLNSTASHSNNNNTANNAAGRLSNMRMRRDRSNLNLGATTHLFSQPHNPYLIQNNKISSIPRAASNTSIEIDVTPPLSLANGIEDDENAETSEKCYELIKFISAIHDKSETRLNKYWDINPRFYNTQYYNNEIVNKGLDELNAKFILENRIRIDLSRISYLLKIDKQKQLKDWHKLLLIDNLPFQFETQICNKEKLTAVKIGSGACGDVLKLQITGELKDEHNESLCGWPPLNSVVAVKRFLPRALNQNVRSFYEKVIIEYETAKLVYYASKTTDLNKHFVEVYGLFVDDVNNTNNGSSLSPCPSNVHVNFQRDKYSQRFNYTPYNPHEELKIYELSLNKFPQFSMITEYLAVDLIAVISELTDHKKTCIFKQLCKVVYYLHDSLNLIHRDIKLDNILLTNDGVIKLIDFGNANLLSTSSDLVKGILGSDAYLAPEVLISPHSYNGKPVDVWAIAVVFVGMWLNKFPWRIGHADDVGFALFSQQPSHSVVSVSNYRNQDDDYNNWLGDDYGMSNVDSTHSNSGNSQSTQTNSYNEDYGNWLGDDYGQNNNNVKVIDSFNNLEGDPFGLKFIENAIRGKNFLLKQLPVTMRPIIDQMLLLDSLERFNMREVINMEEFKLVDCCLGY
ncbi:hypothetical protein QEN19_003613 [Hanseniaspora menglaensis]